MNDQFQDNISTFRPEEKYVLMLLYAPDKNGKFGASIRGNLWLQKEMFLLSKNLDELQELYFDDHVYGPYSPTVQAIQRQFVNSDIISQPIEQGTIVPTQKGKDIAEKIWRNSVEQIKEIVTGVKQLLNDLTSREVIGLIYTSYPETTDNSDVVEQYNKTRLDSAISLFRKKKVSLEKAAQIGDKTLEEFLHLLKKRKIPAFEVEKARFEEDLSFIENIVRR
jgi:predicted HTH domain antitoxin